MLDAAAEPLTEAAEVVVAAGTPAEWQAAITAWSVAQQHIGTGLRTYLADGLPSIAGLDALIAATGWGAVEGVRGDVPVGPLHLSVASSAAVIPAPAGAGTVEPLILGPYRPDSIAARLATPLGAPGSGALARLHDGFGGRIQLPLGVVAVDAAAVLQRLLDGSMSFLGIIGAQFTPPLQLSFGFSLDRVGGLVGINRRVDLDALGRAIRTGAAGDLLFAPRPPDSPAKLLGTAATLFPPMAGRHLVGPSVKLGWLSFGEAGSLLGASLAVVVELPTGKLALIGMAQATIPGLSHLINLRLDVLGAVDLQQRLVAIDASLVDSHAFGIFELRGDAAMCVSWGSQAHSVLSLGGFRPGFNPEPARLPALRRIAMSLDHPLGPISVSVQGYFALTSNTVQLGGRLDVTIKLGLRAHGFLEVNALVQYRPFRFDADCSGGLDVSVLGETFAGVRFTGRLTGPGPLVLRGRLTIETFIDDFSWSKTITLAGGPGDAMPTPASLLDAMAKELGQAQNLRADNTHDPDVVLEPVVGTAGLVALPPTGALRFEQRLAPLDVYVDRVHGHPLGSLQNVRLTSPGPATTAQFAPGSYITLTDSEMLSKPPFEMLQSGAVLAPKVDPSKQDTPLTAPLGVNQMVIWNNKPLGKPFAGIVERLREAILMIEASQAPPALGNTLPCVTAGPTPWTAMTDVGAVGFDSATAAFQFAAKKGGFAVASAELDHTLDLSGV